MPQTPDMNNQHWFSYWLETIMQQAITRANVDPDLCRHMASLSHNGYNCRFLLRIVTGTLVSILRNIMVRTNMLIAYANFMNDTKINPMRFLQIELAELCRHMASLSHHGYKCRFLLRTITGTLVSILRNIMTRTNMFIAYANLMNETKIFPMRFLNNRTGWTHQFV